ncbi:hypothetical protein ACIBG8_29000 [Nonomuraea sp. NPDC050556]|uniref:hypothetical protein n=1 Tax=Nonomuraea sp. NPDC050556 TaxID=3364369 RepID=UPI00379F2243
MRGLFLIAALLVSAPAVHDPNGDGTEVSAQPWGYLITGKKGPRPGGGTSSTGAGGGQGVTCSYTPWHVNGQQNGGLEFVDPASNPNSKAKGDGAYYLVECTDGYRDVLWIPDGELGPTITPEQLARQAYAQIPIGDPKVFTAPPRGSSGLVGLPHWYYLAKGEWTAKSKRLQVGDVWAEATATPTKMTVNPGTGKTITCGGPGTFYNPAKKASQQRSNCAALYVKPNAAYQATVTVIWSGTWVGSGGSGGTLPSITRSVTFPVLVAEAQALVTKG